MALVFRLGEVKKIVTSSNNTISLQTNYNCFETSVLDRVKSQIFVLKLLNVLSFKVFSAVVKYLIL